MESREMEEGKSVLGRCIGRSTHTCILFRKTLSIGGEELGYITIAENFIFCHLVFTDGEEWLRWKILSYVDGDNVAVAVTAILGIFGLLKAA